MYVCNMYVCMANILPLCGAMVLFMDDAELTLTLKQHGLIIGLIIDR